MSNRPYKESYQYFSSLAFAVVTLPSAHHQWSVSNASVAQVDSKTGLAYAWNLGMAAVIVEDTRIAGHVQVSSLNVVLPASLCLYISPLSSSGDPVEGIKSIALTTRWYVVSGHQYLIQIKVFAHDHDAQEIYITEVDCVILLSLPNMNGKTCLYCLVNFSSMICIYSIYFICSDFKDNFS